MLKLKSVQEEGDMDSNGPGRAYPPRAGGLVQVHGGRQVRPGVAQGQILKIPVAVGDRPVPARGRGVLRDLRGGTKTDPGWGFAESFYPIIYIL